MDTFTKKEDQKQNFEVQAEAMQIEVQEIQKKDDEIKLLKINLNIKENEIQELWNLLEDNQHGQNLVNQQTTDVEKNITEKLNAQEISNVNLKKDITHLKSQTQEKDAEISSLKVEIYSKSSEISRLRNRMESYRTKKRESSLKFDSMKRPNKEVTYLKQKIGFLIEKIEQNNILLDHQDKNILNLNDIENLSKDNNINSGSNYNSRPISKLPDNTDFQRSKFDFELNFSNIEVSEILDRKENKDVSE